ncbi:MAG: hypothetical protein PUP91_29740 [Rhizonema sp. PD37]|nr:hypothetical protein [Rhizonema sp. PD37]
MRGASAQFVAGDRINLTCVRYLEIHNPQLGLILIYFVGISLMAIAWYKTLEREVKMYEYIRLNQFVRIVTYTENI